MNDHMTVIMKPTNQCNLRCKYCYHAENGYSNDKMSEATLQKTIAVTAPFVKHITYNWHGGEPLMMGTNSNARIKSYEIPSKPTVHCLRMTSRPFLRRTISAWEFHMTDHSTILFGGQQIKPCSDTAMYSMQAYPAALSPS